MLSLLLQIWLLQEAQSQKIVQCVKCGQNVFLNPSILGPKNQFDLEMNIYFYCVCTILLEKITGGPNKHFKAENSGHFFISNIFRPFPNFFRKKRNRERKKLSRCFGFSVFFAVANIFYRYRTIEIFYAHYISIFKY